MAVDWDDCRSDYRRNSFKMNARATPETTPVSAFRRKYIGDDEITKRTSQKGSQEIDNTDPMFQQDTDEESYKRYKHRQYRNLIIKSLLALVLGLLVKFLILR